jgi:single stranded DNA-binding protein
VNDAIITVVGYVAAEPRYEVLASGIPVLSLRVGSTPRRYDRDIGQWRDDDPMFLTASCWRGLADNLQACELKRGDPVIVTGRLRIREYTKDGQRRFSAQIEATTVGHDLSRGVARFQRTQRSAALPEDRKQADDLADRWLDEEDTGEETSAESTETDETTENDDPGTFRAVA